MDTRLEFTYIDYEKALSNLCGVERMRTRIGFYASHNALAACPSSVFPAQIFASNDFIDILHIFTSSA